MTVLEIIEDAVSDALGLERDPIQNNVIQEGIARYRKCGKIIFDLFPWDNRKLPYFNTDSADATLMTSYTTTTGIIIFGTSIDIVRAVRSIETSDNDDTGGLIWAQSVINAAVIGENVSSVRFIPMDDSAAGNRRISVRIDDEVAKYRIVATKRFVPAIIDAAYDALDPTATPTDYRVLEWPIHHADPAIVAYVADELRGWDGQTEKEDWNSLLQVGINKVDNQQARDHQITPQDPEFNDLDENDSDVW